MQFGNLTLKQCKYSWILFNGDQNRLGIYKKAKLANVFKWKLSELGYSADFVDRATKELATRLASSKAQSTNPSPKLLS